MTGPTEGPTHGPATAVTVPIAGAPAVGLDELTASAGLMTRTDRKYVLTAHEARDLLAALAPSARVLEINDERDFGYESTYFDTADLAAFRQAATRRRRRFKVRTRRYVDTGACFVEVKTRAARGVTVKERLPHDDDASLGAGRGFVADRLAAADLPDLAAAPLVPTLRTRYRRTTLLLPDARMTVDTGLAWTLLDDGAPAAQAAAGDLVVVETKTGSAPSGADRLLWRAGHRPDRISKYATGLAVLRPDLPDAPWRRLRRRHLADVVPCPA